MSTTNNNEIMDVSKNIKFSIPFHLFGPQKALKPTIDDEEIKITEGFVVTQTKALAYRGNGQDIIRNSDTIGYFQEQYPPGGEAMLVFLTREQVKEIVLNPDKVASEICNLVIVKKDGSMVPGFLPDFGDFALLPKALKVVLRWMFEGYHNTPPVMRRFWLSVSPVLPTTRNETVVQYGFARFKCYNFPSRIHMFRVPLPSRKTIGFDVHYKFVNSSPMDGRKYKFELSVSHKPESRKGIENCNNERFELIDRPQVEIMVWNCLGMGRPSFLGNFQHLKKCHTPDINVLLETRMSRHLLHSVLRDCSLYKVVGLYPSNVYGGVAVLSVQNKIQFVLHDRNDGKISGCLKGNKLLYH